MKDKKIEAKRIIIFCFLAFAPLCIITPILNHIFDEMIFASVNEKTVSAAYVLGALGMLSPAVANIMTRLITKEGFADSYLAANFSDNKRYYILSVAVKLAENLLNIFLIYLVFLNGFKISEVFSSENAGQKTATLLLQLAYSIIMFFPAFGEEFGWRGYLMPKLIQLIGKSAAILVGGIIWGLWHAPLTISGHNFGTDYRFYPYSGILLMCAVCIFINAFLTLLTERTKSVYPASFCHMVNNNCNTVMLLGLFGTEQAVLKVSEISPISIFLISLPSMAIVGIISFFMLMKKEKNKY